MEIAVHMDDVPVPIPASVPRVYTASHANETHANAADGSVIEQVKENVEPLRRGRDPHALIKALNKGNAGTAVAATTAVTCAPASASVAAPPPAAAPAVSSEASLKAERKALEAAIKSYTGPSPLEPWMAYIKWTQQSYPTAAPSSHLLPLLEKCTRTFLKDERVRHTLQYLQVWFMYMDVVEDPLDMFAFLQLQGIGVKHVQLFEGWSLTLERRGRTQDALDALQLGLNSGAQPAWRLKNAKQRMQERAAKSIAQAVIADPQAFDSAQAGAGAGGAPLTQEQRIAAAAQLLADENGGTVRQPLQRIGGGADRAPVFERPSNGQTMYAGVPGAARAVTAAAAGSNPFAGAKKAGAASSSNASNFQVFCDDSLSAAPASSTAMPAPFSSITAAPSAAAAAASAVSSSSSLAPVWNEYATVASSSKENRQKASSWAEPLHAPSAAAAGAGAGAEGSILTLPPALPKAISNIAVFVDADCAAADLRARNAAELDAASAAASGGVRQQLDQAKKNNVLQATTEKASHVSFAKLSAQPLRHMKK
jgi:checkpoint serine/threonine-protein kinase